MSDVLWITLIGMGLVFIAILLLWGLMVLLVRLTAEKQETSPVERPLVVLDGSDLLPTTPDRARKRRAAAAGVAVALALAQPESAARQAGSSISAWQAVHRAGQLNRVQPSRRRGIQ